jgi:hypothetical protein
VDGIRRDTGCQDRRAGALNHGAYIETIRYQKTARNGAPQDGYGTRTARGANKRADAASIAVDREAVRRK